MSQQLSIVSGIAAPLLRDYMDAMTVCPRTPAEKGGAATQGGRETVGPEAAFAALRFDEAGVARPEFVLNRPEFAGARVLISRKSFCCGSAREHSVWALLNFGIQCVIAESFGPLFYGNCFKNGLIPIMLPPAEIARLAQEVAPGGKAAMLSLDLGKCTIATASGRTVPFEMPAFRLKQLVEGLDEIDMTLALADKISAFHAAGRKSKPWLYTQSQPQAHSRNGTDDLT